MWLQHVYQRVAVHMLVNMRAFSCHFGLLPRARCTAGPRMCEPHLGHIDVMMSTRASVKARSLDVDLVWHWPCTNFGSELWILHYRCCPTTLSGKAPDLATRSALMLPLPLRPDKLSNSPAEHLEEHSRYASPSSLSTNWKCSLLLLELPSDRHRASERSVRIILPLRLLVRDNLSACCLHTWVNA